MRLEKELNVALDLAKQAGVIIKKHYEAGIGHSMKSNNTPVTQADIESNELILKGLTSAFPNDGIVSEEMIEVKGSSSRLWHVDPLDGTSSFVDRAGTFAVHIGLTIDDLPVLGVVHQPMTMQTYAGVKGKGAFKILPDGTEHDIMISGNLGHLVAVIERGNKDFEQYGLLFEKMHVTRYERTGGEGLRIMKIVDGLAHFKLGNGASPTWDTCAPHAILEAAGGVCEYATLNEKVLYTSPKLKDKLIYARDKKTIDMIRSFL